MPVGEADSSWAVRTLPVPPPASTFQDLKGVQVTFSLPGSLWSLWRPPELPETPFLCTLSGFSPWNSGDPKSEPALLTNASDLSILPITFFHKGEAGLREV